MQFRVGFKTDIGMRRQKNQDSGGAFPELGLFIVADGMGGHRGGEVASSMVVEMLPELIAGAKSQSDYSPPVALSRAIQLINRKVFERSVQDAELQGMGTTATVFLFNDTHVTIGHVGDSRAYLACNEGLWQLTRDHSLVQEKLRAGLITREQLKTDQSKNVITRSVGFTQETQVEIYVRTARVGEAYMLCSDGLSGQVEDAEIFEWMRENVMEKHQPQIAVEHLVRRSNENGGHDNVTSLIVEIV